MPCREYGVLGGQRHGRHQDERKTQEERAEAFEATHWGSPFAEVRSPADRPSAAGGNSILWQRVAQGKAIRGDAAITAR